MQNLANFGTRGCRFTKKLNEPMNDPVKIYRIGLAVFISMQQETQFLINQFLRKVNIPVQENVEIS